MKTIEQLLHQLVLGQEAFRFALAFLIILASLILRRIFDKLIAAKLRHWAARTNFIYDDILISALNLKIMDLVQELGLSFAFPSRTLYFGGSPGLEERRASPHSERPS